MVANFSNSDFSSYRIGIPLNENWVEIVNSQNSKYMGDGATNPGPITPQAIASDGYSQSIEMALAKMAFVILMPEASVGIGVGDSPAYDFLLHTPYPNPMLGGSRIAFDLAEPGRARLTVHDVAGRLIRIVGDDFYQRGRNEVSWDGADDSGERVAAGIYLVRIQSGGKVADRKVVVID